MFKELGQVMGLMKNLPRLQAAMQDMQTKLGQITVEGNAGAGMVVVAVNGRMELTKCVISEDAIKLNDRDIQFPRPDDRRITRPTRQGFANLNLTSIDGRVDGMDAVIRFDTQTGTEDIYHFGAGAAAGEFVFAPRIGAVDEADGYAITIVHPADSATSQLAIFNAMDVAAGPIARVHVPFRVPSGFHCNYYSADNPLYQKALEA